MRPNDPNNIQKISEGHAPAYQLIDAESFLTKKVQVTLGDQTREFSFAELSLYTSVEMKNLTVKSIYTTDNDESSSKGAMTLTCEIGGKTVSVRTVVLHDESGKLVTAEAFENKTIDVKGLVDYFDGTYQIKVFSIADIHIH